jgi:flavoprotein
MTFKLVWAMTGTGYMLQESIDLMKELQDAHKIELTVLLSKEGETVVKWYKKWLTLTEVVKKVKVEQTPNLPFYAGPLQLGNFDMFIVCPTSANTVAKIVHGIADSLVSNCVAQAIKGGQTVYIFPSDQDVEPIVTTRPDGSPLILKIRDIEIENIKRLKNLEGMHVFSDFLEIKTIILKKFNEESKN